MKKVILFGTGECAQVAHIYLTKDSPYEVVGFTVHERFITNSTFSGLRVVPFEGLVHSHPPDDFAMLVSIGFKRMNRARAEIYEACKLQGYECISYVSSKAWQWGKVEIGDNCFIFENNVLQPFVKIGNNCTLWSGNHIGHHVTIEDHCFITSQVVVSGGTQVGSYCFLGVNATIRDHIRIGSGCLIGAGALVLKNADPDGFYPEKGTERSEVPVSRLKNL